MRSHDVTPLGATHGALIVYKTIYNQVSLSYLRIRNMV